MASGSLSNRDVRKTFPWFNGRYSQIWPPSFPRSEEHGKNWDSYLCIPGSIWFLEQTRERTSNTEILPPPPTHTDMCEQHI